jgi:hypothetical protein
VILNGILKLHGVKQSAVRDNKEIPDSKIGPQFNPEKKAGD